MLRALHCVEDVFKLLFFLTSRNTLRKLDSNFISMSNQYYFDPLFLKELAGAHSPCPLCLFGNQGLS